MKINQLKSGVVISYLSQIIHILTGVLYTPVMLRLLGQSEYGLYQLVGSVVSYLSLLSMGFNTGYMRFYSKYKTKNDNEGIAKLNGLFIIIFLVISLLCLVCGGILTFNAELVFGSKLTIQELSKSKILMSIMVVSMAISLIDSVFKCYITAHERFFFQQMVNLLKALLNPFVTLPLLIMGYGSVSMVLISCFLTIGVFFCDCIYSVKKLKMQFSFGHSEKGLLKEIWIFTSFIFMNMIVDQLNWSIDKILLGRIIGTTAVAVYGVAGQLNTLYLTFSGTVSNVFVPRVNMIVAQKNDDRELTDLFTKVGRVQFIILGLIISGYIVFGKEFISIWAGNGYEQSYYIGLFLMIPVTIPLIQNLGIEIQKAKNMHKVRSLVYLLIAISNIFVSIPCIKMWGARGAAVGTALSLFIGNCLFMNIYYHKKVNLDIIYFWKETLKCLPAFVLTMIIGLIVKNFLPSDKMGYLLVEIIIYCCIYAALMWLMGMNNSEKDIFRKPIRQIGEKICRK